MCVCCACVCIGSLDVPMSATFDPCRAFGGEGEADPGSTSSCGARGRLSAHDTNSRDNTNNGNIRLE